MRLHFVSDPIRTIEDALPDRFGQSLTYILPRLSYKVLVVEDLACGGICKKDCSVAVDLAHRTRIHLGKLRHLSKFLFDSTLFR